MTKKTVAPKTARAKKTNTNKGGNHISQRDVALFGNLVAEMKADLAKILENCDGLCTDALLVTGIEEGDRHSRRQYVTQMLERNRRMIARLGVCETRTLLLSRYFPVSAVAS